MWQPWKMSLASLWTEIWTSALQNINRRVHYKQISIWIIFCTQISLHSALLAMNRHIWTTSHVAWFNERNACSLVKYMTVHRDNIWHHILTKTAYIRYSFCFQLNFLYGACGSHNKELCIKVFWNVSPCSLVETCLPHYMVLYPRQLRS